MAVFLLNVCKFKDCGQSYPSLADLIHHIEETHVGLDMVSEPNVKHQPTCIPLSLALRLFYPLTSTTLATSRVDSLLSARCLCVRSSTDHTNTSTAGGADNNCSSDGSEESSPGTPPHPPSTGARLFTPSLLSRVVLTSPRLGASANFTHFRAAKSHDHLHELPDIDTMDSDDSNDSWTTQEEYSVEYIMKYGSKVSKDSACREKPYICPVPDCTKRYKNVNGIKYHAKHGHKKDTKIRKLYKCHCGKSYRTSHGLHLHAVHSHPGVSLTTVSTSSGEVLQIPLNMVTPLRVGGKPRTLLGVSSAHQVALSSVGAPQSTISRAHTSAVQSSVISLLGRDGLKKYSLASRPMKTLLISLNSSSSACTTVTSTTVADHSTRQSLSSNSAPCTVQEQQTQSGHVTRPCTTAARTSPTHCDPARSPGHQVSEAEHCAATVGSMERSAVDGACARAVHSVRSQMACVSDSDVQITHFSIIKRDIQATSKQISPVPDISAGESKVRATLGVEEGDWEGVGGNSNKRPHLECCPELSHSPLLPSPPLTPHDEGTVGEHLERSYHDLFPDVTGVVGLSSAPPHQTHTQYV